MSKQDSNQDENLSLAKLMDKVYEAEEGLIDLTEQEIKELFGDLKTKVDNIYEYLQRLGEYELRYAERIKKLQARKKTIRNRIDGLNQYIVFVMQANDTPELYGFDHTLKLRETKTIKAKDNIEITSDHYLELNDGIETPVVKREYKFDAMALKNAYKNNPEKYKDFIIEGKTISPSFSLKKEV